MATHVCQIERGIRMPTTVRMRYRWFEIEVGESFLVPYTNRDPIRHAKQLANFANKLKRERGLAFSVRKQSDGIRVWRIK